MDEGIWAVWFDLNAKAMPSHLKWLHNEYLPELSAQPGIAWAVHFELHPEIYTKQRNRLVHTKDPIGQAMQHLVLVGAVSSNLFFHANSPLEKKNQSKASIRNPVAGNIKRCGAGSTSQFNQPPMLSGSAPTGGNNS